MYQQDLMEYHDESYEQNDFHPEQEPLVEFPEYDGEDATDIIEPKPPYDHGDGDGRKSSRFSVSKNNIQSRCGKLLAQLGWGSGVRIPFSNTENQALEKALDLKQRKILELESELIDNTEHAQSLEKGIGSIQEDIQCVHRLWNNKAAILEGEKTLYANAERMLTTTLREKAICEKNLQDCQQRCNSIQQSMDKRLKKVLELRNQIQFDSEALKEYHERLRIFNEISSDVTRLNEEDCKSIRELEDAKVDLGAKRKELRHQLDKEAMNTAKFQEQFDRLCVEFRKVHRQRLDMVAMWTTTINAMAEKDSYMKEIADEYFNTKKQLRNMGDSIAENEKRLKMQTCGIRGTELHLADLDRKISDIRLRINEEKEIVETMKDSCLLCQVEVQSGYNLMKSAVEAIAKLETELKVARRKTKKAAKVVQELRATLKGLELGQYDKERRTHELEIVFEKEEKAHERLNKEMDALKHKSWELNYEKTSTNQQMATTDTLVSRARSYLDLLFNMETSNQEHVAKRSGAIYRLDLECSVLENRIGRMTSQSADPRYFELQNSLRELREVEKAVMKDKNFITFELEHVSRMYAKCNVDLGKYRIELAVLEDRLLQCDMNTHGLEKCLIQFNQELNSELVKQSLERVYLKRLMEALTSEKRQMFGLAELRNTIHWAVRERKAEIENHKILNLIKQKTLTSTITKFRVQVAEVDSRTRALKGRFDLMTRLMAATEAADPEKLSITYQIKKFAKEREVIETEVEIWKARLAQAEKELEGLMNVYQIMNASNVSLKESLSPAEEESTERQELEALTGQEEEIILRRNKALKSKQILRDRIEDLALQIANKEQDLRGTTQLYHVKETLAKKLDHELSRQKEKIDRWSAMCHKLLREIKSNLPKDQGELMQLDLKLRLTITKLDSAIVMLQRLLAQHQQAAPTVHHLLRQLGLSHLIHYKPTKFGVPPPASKRGSSEVVSLYSIASPSVIQQDSEMHAGLSMDNNQVSNAASRVSPVSTATRVVQRMKPTSRLQSHGVDKSQSKKGLGPRGK